MSRERPHKTATGNKSIFPVRSRTAQNILFHAGQTWRCRRFSMALSQQEIYWNVSIFEVALGFLFFYFVFRVSWLSSASSLTVVFVAVFLFRSAITLRCERRRRRVEDRRRIFFVREICYGYCWSAKRFYLPANCAMRLLNWIPDPTQSTT